MSFRDDSKDPFHGWDGCSDVGGQEERDHCHCTTSKHKFSVCVACRYKVCMDCGNHDRGRRIDTCGACAGGMCTNCDEEMQSQECAPVRCSVNVPGCGPCNDLLVVAEFGMKLATWPTA